MALTPNETQPDDPINLPAARRRRARRRLVSTLDSDERASYLDAATRRAAPTFDFFIFSMLAGAILGVALLIDSPYLLLLGILFAPLMAPAVGISLGTVLGSARTFSRSLAGLVTSGFLVLLVGALAGFGSRLWPPMELLQAHLYTQLAWPALIVITIAAVLTSATLLREKHNPAIPSVALAFSFFVPLSAAGFGLGSGVSHLWPDGLVVFTVHLAWATLVGAITLWYMGFRPYTLFGYSLGGVIALIGAIFVIGFGGLGAIIGGGVALPTAIPSPTATLPPSPTASQTPLPPTFTITPSITPTITLTPTQTNTPSPTPVLALIRVSSDFGGAVLRNEPGGKIIVATLINGSLVQILPDEPVFTNGSIWVHVLALENNIDGWILQSLLVTATPPPAADTLTPVPSASGTTTPQP